MLMLILAFSVSRPREVYVEPATIELSPAGARPEMIGLC